LTASNSAAIGTRTRVEIGIGIGKVGNQRRG
jgi:hypothetical protein